MIPTPTLHLRHTLPLQCPIFSTTLTPSGSHVALSGADRKIHLWNPYSRLHVTTLTGHGHQVLSTSFNTTASHLVSGGADHALFLWDLHTATLLKKLRGHSQTVNQVQYTPALSPALIVSASYDASAKIWDPRAMKPLVQTLPRFRDSVTSVLWAGHQVLAGGVDQTVRTFDIRAASMSIDTLNAPVSSLALSGDGECILVACLDSSLWMLERQSGKLLCKYGGHANKDFALQCAFLADDSAVLCGSEQGDLCMWQVGGDELPVCKVGMGGVVGALDSHASQNLVVAATHEGRVSLWAVE